MRLFDWLQNTRGRIVTRELHLFNWSGRTNCIFWIGSRTLAIEFSLESHLFNWVQNTHGRNFSRIASFELGVEFSLELHLFGWDQNTVVRTSTKLRRLHTCLKFVKGYKKWINISNWFWGSREAGGTPVNIKVISGFSFFHPNAELELSDHHHILCGGSTHEFYRLRELQVNRATLILQNLDFSTSPEDGIWPNPRSEFEFAL